MVLIKHLENPSEIHVRIRDEINVYKTADGKGGGGRGWIPRERI